MRITAFGVALLLALPAAAAERRAADDDLVAQVRAAHTKLTGERVIVWTPATWTAEEQKATATKLGDVVARVEALLGKSVAEGYGQRRMEYFVSDDDATPSHVYAGYEHDPASDPPYVFLSGLRSGEAPHIHETTHIVGGPFGSLLLREGLATYVQFKLEPGKMRPLVKLGEVTDVATLDAAVEKLLASPKTNKQTLAWLEQPVRSVSFASRPERAVFYAVSASFVAFLVDEIGMEKFMRVYAAEDVRAALEKESGKSWSSWTNAWLGRFGQGPQRA